MILVRPQEDDTEAFSLQLISAPPRAAGCVYESYRSIQPVYVSLRRY